MNLVTWLLLVFILFFSTPRWATQASKLHGREQLEKIIRTLPKTGFRRWLEHATPGSGIREGYMDSMQNAGVKRALIEVHGVWRHGILGAPFITSRMYFSKYDGRGSLIRDERILHNIQASGLQDILDQVALEQIKEAYPFSLHTVPNLDNKEVYGRVELYDTPWLPPTRPGISAQDSRQAPLFDASASGDMLTLDQLLRIQKFSQADLDRALWEAVAEYRDNTEVMELLVRAGANVNSRLGEDFKTPLMIALRNPVHVKFLLDAGAQADAKDCCGNTPLTLAKRAGEQDSVKILEQAESAP